MDDRAFRRGTTDGTILVDLAAHTVVDLLPDRTAATLAAWLRRHPSVEVIARDRSTEYTRAATEAAPHALQVADRWHLLRNARDMAERWFASVYPRLRRVPSLAAAAAADAAAHDETAQCRERRARAMRMPTAKPTTYITPYHRIAIGPIGTMIGEMSGLGIVTAEREGRAVRVVRRRASHSEARGVPARRTRR